MATRLASVQADPFAQLRLLDLQAADSTLSRLDHRERGLPEVKALAANETWRSELADDQVRTEAELSDLAREQRRLEDDVEVVRAREERDNTRLTSGLITNAKELDSLQHELASLTRRQSELEDIVLELMERRESVEGRQAKLVEDLAGAETERTGLQRDRDAALTEIGGQRADARAERDQLVAGLPDDLVTLYDRIRASAGGIGAAALRQRRCEGCRIDLAGSDLSKARSAKPEEVLRCEECNRILVRTAESGL